MAFKMKGHELPGPNQKKSPTKWIGLVISGISAIASAAKADKERKAAARKKASDAMKDSTAADSTTGKQDPNKIADSSSIADSSKIDKADGFKANMSGVSKKK